MVDFFFIITLFLFSYSIDALKNSFIETQLMYNWLP